MQALDTIKEQLPELQNRFYVSRIGIFGSSARGDERESSDIDILVEFSETVDLFQFIDLKLYLEMLLGRKVDLVTENALKPRIKDKILREVVYI